MTIRDAKPDDFDAVQALNREIFDFEYKHCDPTSNIEYPFQEAGIKYINNITSRANGHLGIVFEEDGIIKGYASLRDVPSDEIEHRKNVKQAQMQTLCVGHEWRGQGIGRKLLDKCQAIAKNNGYTHLKIVALAKNARARHLYTSAGFEETEITHEVKL